MRETNTGAPSAGYLRDEHNSGYFPTAAKCEHLGALLEHARLSGPDDLGVQQLDSLFFLLFHACRKHGRYTLQTYSMPPRRSARRS